MRNLILRLIFAIGCNPKTKEQTTTNNMENWNKYFVIIYDNFNKRNIDFVIHKMTSDVKWADGMDGGFVYGHEDVRENNGKIIIKVHQVVQDIDGKLIADETVTHIFKLEGDKIAHFDIEK